MNLSPAWVEALRAMGVEATHWSTIGNPRASDRELLAYAKAGGYVVFTNDLDFGAILAASAASSPSVIQVRAADVTPTQLGTMVQSALTQYADWLDAGRPGHDRPGSSEGPHPSPEAARLTGTYTSNRGGRKARFFTSAPPPTAYEGTVMLRGVEQLVRAGKPVSTKITCRGTCRGRGRSVRPWALSSRAR